MAKRSVTEKSPLSANVLRPALTAASAVILCCALCICLYIFDNKYTSDASQPIGGIFIYDPEKQVTPLIREWIVYPDVLLTPDTMQSYSGYRYYGDIGGENSFAGDTSYRLTVLLPDEPDIWALGMTEVFSSVNVWVNGECVMSRGSHEPYSEGITESAAIFRASGITDILITSSDRSGINGGMTYPPLFGRAEDVSSVREVRILIHGAAMLLCIAGAAMSLVLCAENSVTQSILSSILCLCAAVQTGYPVYHGFLTLPAQPMYTIEPLCAYGILFLSLFLCCSLCGIDKKAAVLAPGAVGLILTLLRFGLAAYLPTGAAEAFSVFSALLKYYTAIAIAVISVRAVLKNTFPRTIVIWGAFSECVCLAFDRILPLHEPFYTAWFSELGGFLLAASVTAALWLDAAEAHRLRRSYENSLSIMERKLLMQKEHYAKLSGEIRFAREAAHDLRHHLRVLKTFTDRRDWSSLSEYLADYSAHTNEHTVQTWSEHPAADAILTYYASEALSAGAVYDVRFSVPPDIKFPEDELCIVLANLMENAAEALKSQECGDKILTLRGEFTDGIIRIALDNTFSGEINQKNGVFLSTKHTGCGIGLSSVSAIAEKHGGLTDFSAQNGVFRSSVILPVPRM